MKYIIMPILISVIASSLFADDHTADNVYVGEVRVDNRFGSFYSFKKEDNSNWAGCNDPVIWNHSQHTEEGDKAILSALLTAKSAHLPVTVYYNDDDGNCRLKQLTLK